jgi:hypothetical protein
LTRAVWRGLAGRSLIAVDFLVFVALTLDGFFGIDVLPVIG